MDTFNSGQDDSSNSMSTSPYIGSKDINNFLNNPSFSNKSGLLNLNIQGIQSKWNSFTSFIHDSQINSISPYDIITLQETHLSSTNNTDLYHINGFTPYFKNRPHDSTCKKGGGLVTYINSNLDSCIKPIFFPTKKQIAFDCQFTEISLNNNKKILVGNIYRRPELSNVQDFLNTLNDTINVIKNYSDIILTGDFNINMLKTNSNNYSARLMDIMITNGFSPKITLPTRVCKTVASLIDNVFYKGKDNDTISGIIKSTMSDHYPMFTLFNYSKTKNTVEIIKTRPIQNQNINTFLHDLNNEDWNHIQSLPSTQVDEKYNKFLEKYSYLFNKHFPIKEVKFNKYRHKINPWITKGLLNSLKYKDKLFHKIAKTKNISTRQSAINTHKNYKTLLNTLMRKAKSSYWLKKI